MHKRTDLATRARVLSDQASQKAVLDALRSGMSTSSASSLVGITREALRLYRKTDPDFHQACIQAVAEFEAEQLGIVRSASFDDAKNAQWLLERRFPQKWSNRIEIKQFGEDDDADRESDDARELSDEELLALAGGKP